jgi:hypothetical protein
MLAAVSAHLQQGEYRQAEETLRAVAAALDNSLTSGVIYPFGGILSP